MQRRIGIKEVAMVSLILAIVNKTYISMADGTEKCYLVRELRLVDAYNISNIELKALKKRYEDRCLNLEEIKELVRYVNNLYAERGYITSRAYLPEQDLSSERLIIQVREGLLEGIEYEQAKIRTSNLPIKQGKIISLRDIEQSIDILNKGNAAVKLHLKPGSEEGKTIIVMDYEKSKKLSFTTGIDNSGNKNKGIYQSFSNISFSNVFGYLPSLKSRVKNLFLQNLLWFTLHKISYSLT
jgi:hemolysin activation/secretion protein